MRCSRTGNRNGHIVHFNVMTSHPALTNCPAELRIRVRYENDDLARSRAPQNISVEFKVQP